MGLKAVVHNQDQQRGTSAIDERDLKILEASYNCVADPESFDSLVDTLHQRIVERDGTEAGLGKALTDQLTNVAGIMQRMPQPPAQNEQERLVATSSAPAFAVNAAGAVVDLNAAANLRFDIRRGSSVDGSWLNPTSRSGLDDLLRGLRPGANGGHVVLRTVDVNGQTGLAEGFVVNDDMPVAIIRSIELGWAERVGHVLQSAFGLTDTEVDVTRRLFSLHSIEAIAEERGAAVRTVRTQLQAIYAKTDTSKQTELLQLVGALAATAPAVGKTNLLWQDPLRREEIITTTEGRALAYSWMGAASGRPVILTHGAFTGYVLSDRLRRALERQNLKVYTLCRPGFGNSDADPGRSNLDAAVAALNELMNHLRLESCPAIGLMNGTTPLVRFAAEHPGRISRILSLGAAMPLDEPEDYQRLPAQVVTMLKLRRNLPRLCEIACLASFRLVRALGMSSGLDRMFGHSEPDRETMLNPEVRSLLAASASMLAAQGHRAFYNDLALIAADWRADIQQLPCRCVVLYGEADPIFRPNKVEAMAAVCSQLAPVLVPKAGQLVMFQAEGLVEEHFADLYGP